MRALLLLLIFSTTYVHSAGIRRNVCEFMGKTMENLSEAFGASACEEGNFPEYQKFACGLTSANNGRFFHEGINSNSHRLYNQSSDNFFHNLSDEVVLQGVANNIYDFNKCQRDFYRLYFNDEEKRNSVRGQALEAYTAFYRDLIHTRQEMDTRRREGLGSISLTASDGAFVRQLERIAESNEEAQSFHDDMVAAIPFGNRPQMRTYIIRSIQNKKSPEDFISGFDAVIRELGQEANRSFANISDQIKHRQNGGYIFNVDPALRKQFKSAGLVEQYVAENDMQEFAKSGYLCRLDRENDGCVALTAAEVAGSILVPYAAATMAFRAGFIAFRAGGQVMASKMLTNSARALVLGRLGGEALMITDDIMNHCFTDEYMASKSSRECNPQKQFNEILVESEIARCALSASLGVAIPASGAFTNRFLKSQSRRGQNSRRARRAIETAQKKVASEKAPADTGAP